MSMPASGPSRIAVFGDVHGNRFALEAVLEDMQRHAPELYLNLGDQVFGGADPAGAYALQQQLKDAASVHEVRGNTDERLMAELSPTNPPAEKTDKKRAMLQWLLGVLPPDAAPTLAALPTALSVAAGEVLMAHGSPQSVSEYLLLEGKKAEQRWLTDTELRQRLAPQLSDPALAQPKVLLVGHSHLEHLRQLDGLTVVNVGAVSRQKDGCPAARWLLLERTEQAWSVSFRRVPYDQQAAAAWARAHAYDGDKEAQQLLSGRAE